MTGWKRDFYEISRRHLLYDDEERGSLSEGLEIAQRRREVLIELYEQDVYLPMLVKPETGEPAGIWITDNHTFLIAFLDESLARGLENVRPVRSRDVFDRFIREYYMEPQDRPFHCPLGMMLFFDPAFEVNTITAFTFISAAETMKDKAQGSGQEDKEDKE